MYKNYLTLKIKYTTENKKTKEMKTEQKIILDSQELILRFR